jgi:signal transduction histidine kinase
VRFRRFIHARLHRLLFLWLAATILFSGLVAGGVLHAIQGGDPWHEEMRRVATFVSGRFAHVWNDDFERHRLAEELSRLAGFDLVLRDERGKELDRVGKACKNPQISVKVTRDGHELGSVEGCSNRRRRFGGIAGIAALAAACFTLWGASAVLARKLVRPLSDLIRVTREIGSGNLSSRVRIGGRYRGEVAVLAESVNNMAVRIERQLSDQRELLAAVSHEIRSPLARLRVLIELLESRGADPATLQEFEREVLEIDAMVGKLLASSRLDFGALNIQTLVARDLAARALERAGEPAEKLVDESNAATFQGDPTLLERALGNLIENTHKYAPALVELSVRATPTQIEFVVTDAGSGFSEEARRRAFDAFYRGKTSGSLGLGLSLVQRIAKAHGGDARIDNRAEGGACVSVRVSRTQGAAGLASARTSSTSSIDKS